ncbi:hypothetical protein GWN42_15040 [candidate division KSB1 bacterium]|nr:hypothetical protein [candidate division KSB1 bacterium]
MGKKTIDDLKNDSEKWDAIDWQKAYAKVNRLQARIVKAVQDTAGCLTAPYQGLSRMLGNWHVRFLRGLATVPGYPTQKGYGLLSSSFFSQSLFHIPSQVLLKRAHRTGVELQIVISLRT